MRIRPVQSGPLLSSWIFYIDDYICQYKKKELQRQAGISAFAVLICNNETFSNALGHYMIMIN